MKQSAVRTLGVAALGAAFAAAAAGSASAAPSLPVDAATAAVPAGTALDAVSHALPTVQDAAGRILKGQESAGGDVATPVTGLLGGLPTKGLSANGLPLGG
ncbi:hypothetical protein F0344_12920 [Streptomyces finlayi]|uniref:ATP-binding protein n=1 Tax=Streptomyces finlayi TaxID=67296 RepID=A0A7G7BJ86_9ACTN|nr:hypothetical protein [Streptomyces finlayi]QNE75401.1 hypothetical protein F0344_12920 [Streptomyces finlayi]